MSISGNDDLTKSGKALSDRIAELTSGRVTPSSVDGSIGARPDSVASLRLEHRSQTERLQSRLDALEYENERLRAGRMSTPAQDHIALEKTEALRHELATAADRIAELEKSLEESRQNALEVTSDSDLKLRHLEEDHRDVVAALQGKYDEQCKRVTDLEDNLEEAMQELRRTVSIVEDKDKEERQRLEQLEARNVEIEAFRTELKRLKDAFESERVDLNSQVDELRQAGQETIALYEEKLSTTEMQRYELQSRLNALELRERRQSRALEEPAKADAPLTSSAAQIDNETLREHITHLQKRIASLEDALEDAQALAEREETSTRERLKKMKEKEDALKKEFADTKKEMEKMGKGEARANTRIAEIEEALRESGVALENAQAELETVRAEISDLDGLLGDGSGGDIHSRVNEVMQKAASEKSRLTAEVQSLQTALEEARKSSATASSSSDGEVTELQTKNIELVKQIAEHQALVAEERRASDELQHLLEEKANELESVKKKMNRGHAVNGSLQEPKANAPATPNKELNVAREEIKGLKHIVQEMQMESSAAQHKEEILRSENNLLQDELKQLREEVAILEENLDKSITEEEGSSAPSSAKHDAEMAQLRKKIAEAEQKVARVTHDLNKEISELESLVESKIYREDELEQEIERLKEKASRREKKSSKTSTDTTSIRSRVSSDASSKDTPLVGDVCEICERPGHDIFNCDLLKDDSTPAAGSRSSISLNNGLPDPDLYCEDCEGHGHVAASCPHSMDVF